VTAATADGDRARQAERDAIPPRGPRRPVRFGFVTPQQRMTVDELVDQWQFAEAGGWDSAWVIDHFLSHEGSDDGDCLEAWTLLAGLTMRTTRVRIGVFVSGISHRHPGVLLKQAVTVDHLSAGRLILGLGAAWNRREHEALGIPFPPIGERVALVGETLDAFRRLERDGRATYAGRLLQLHDTPFAPRAIQPRLPILVGTTGERMLGHVARFGDDWEGGGGPDRMATLNARLDERCREAGRDPREVSRGIVAADEAFATLRDERAFRRHVLAYAAAGVDTFYFNIPRGAPSRALRRITERAIPDLRAELAVSPPAAAAR
jgi:alkanesulfonate monooxygenase SsuD/methylene tetrahydromethanopterin reductase-like flavin-dependent oxidoreductase (luciferase family)